MRFRHFAGALSIVAAFVVVPSALAHGTLAPVAALAGSSQRFELTVPNARLGADVVEVSVKLPTGVTLESAEARQPSWAVSSQDDLVTWRGGTIAPAATESFAFSARLPSDVGDVEFAMRETWDDGSEPPFFPITVAVTGAPGSGSDSVAIAALVIALLALVAATAALALAIAGRKHSSST